MAARGSSGFSFTTRTSASETSCSKSCFFKYSIDESSIVDMLFTQDRRYESQKQFPTGMKFPTEGLSLCCLRATHHRRRWCVSACLTKH